MKQCSNGHFYDETRFEACPYCQPQNGPAVGKTVALGGGMEAGKTVPLNPVISMDTGKTVGLIKKNTGIDPAVGFAVCISGPQKGQDFKLRAGRNFVGRGAGMDIALVDDDTVSRDNHALISYDLKHNSFMLSPGMGRGITYLNGDQIENAAPLKAYDKIEVGRSVLMFLPLCGENFKWEESEE